MHPGLLVARAQAVDLAGRLQAHAQVGLHALACRTGHHRHSQAVKLESLSQSKSGCLAAVDPVTCDCSRALLLGVRGGACIPATIPAAASAVPLPIRSAPVPGAPTGKWHQCVRRRRRAAQGRRPVAGPRHQPPHWWRLRSRLASFGCVATPTPRAPCIDIAWKASVSVPTGNGMHTQSSFLL